MPIFSSGAAGGGVGFTLPTGVTIGGTGATLVANARYNLGTAIVGNGWEDPTAFTVGYNASSRIFSLGFTGTAAFTSGGVRYPQSTGITFAAHGNTPGHWHLFGTTGGSFVVSQADWSFNTDAPAGQVYYTNSNNGGAAAGLLFVEAHTNSMDIKTRTYLHNTLGTRYVSGLTISGYTLNANGSTSLNYALSAGVIQDEDVQTNVTAITLGATYRFFWKTGTASLPVWNWVDTSGTGNESSGVFTGGAGATNIAYNQLTGGSWQVTNITTNSTYVNYWLVTTNLTTAPQAVIIVGQTTYGTLAAAQAATFSNEISNIADIFDEAIVVYQLTYQRGSTFTGPGLARLVSATKITSSILATSAAASITASNVTTDTGNFLGRLTTTDTNAQTAFESLSNKVTGVTLGGTGATVAATGFNNLSPMTTAGDLIYGGTSGAGTRLPIGTTGQVLTAYGATYPAWATPSGLTNPMTSGGDLIYGGAAGAPTRLANGSLGYVLTSAGSTAAPTWSRPAVLYRQSTAATTLTNSTSVAIPFATAGIDTDSGWSTDTYTTPRAGIWEVSTIIFIGARAYSAGDVIQLRIEIDGAEVEVEYQKNSDTTNTIRMVRGSGIWSLAASKTIKIKVRVDNSSGNSAIDTNFPSSISIKQIGV